MKKLVLFIFLIVGIVSGQQREIKYSMDFVFFEIQLDSINSNTTYTYHDVFFLKKNDQVMMTDSTGVDGYKSSGFYGITVEPDTSRLYPVTDGDTDSLFIYVKELSCDSSVVSNDSTFLTPNSGTTGLDFDLNKIYLYGFDLDGLGAGYRIYARRQDNVGAIRLKVWARR